MKDKRKRFAPKNKDSFLKTDDSTGNNEIMPENSDAGIHPACLFKNINELKNEELKDAAVSLAKRLRGKIKESLPLVINEKYLFLFD